MDGKVIGVIEAKPEGHTLRGVETQSAMYTEGLPDGIPNHRFPIPFAYESTGVVTQFTNGLNRSTSISKESVRVQWLDILTAVASAATACGVGIAAWQLRLTKQQARIQFEDGLVLQYRSIISRLPVQAMLGEALDAESQRKALSVFYDNFDLSNEQAFLRREGRISDDTWDNWKEGIEQNLARPAFAAAWEEVTRRAPESFNTLRDEVPAARKHPALGAEDREEVTSGQPSAAPDTPGA